MCCACMRTSALRVRLIGDLIARMPEWRCDHAPPHTHTHTATHTRRRSEWFWSLIFLKSPYGKTFAQRSCCCSFSHSQWCISHFVQTLSVSSSFFWGALVLLSSWGLLVLKPAPGPTSHPALSCILVRVGKLPLLVCPILVIERSLYKYSYRLERHALRNEWPFIISIISPFSLAVACWGLQLWSLSEKLCTNSFRQDVSGLSRQPGCSGLRASLPQPVGGAGAQPATASSGGPGR